MIVAAFLTLALVLAAPPARAVAAQGPEPSLATLDVPGGVGPLADAIGIDPGLPRARLVLTAIRALYELPDGVDPEADARRARLREYLARLPRSGGPGADVVPLPLSVEAWTALLGGAADAPLIARILGDRDAALLYYGVSALDSATRAWLESQPTLLRRLMSGSRPALMAAFGRSLRVRDARVQVPGGSAADDLWAALVRERPDAPDRFLLRVLDRDRGRLALFYDSLAHLGPGQQAFALGSLQPAAGARRERVASLYEEADRALAGFDPAARPFDRIAHDLAHLLLLTRTGPDGRLGPPTSRSLWRAALLRSGIPSNPAAELSDRNRAIALDAADLVSIVGVADAAVRRERAETWFFGQRVFAAAAERDLPDVLVALRAMPQYKALLLTLERMDIVRPETYALAVRQAQRISSIRDALSARTELAQFQGVLSVIERARFSRTLDSAEADALVRSLCSTDLAAPVREGSRFANWIEDELLPALEARPGLDGRGRPECPIEDRVLAAMSGLAGRAEPGPIIEWEGLVYRVDPGGGEFRRLLAIRARQGGASLDAAMGLARAGAAILGASSPAALTSAQRLLDEALAGFEGLQGREFRRADELDRPVVQILREAAGALRGPRAVRPRDLVRVAQPVFRAAESQLAAVLLSLAYAPHLGYPDSPVLLGGDPSVHHDFGPDRSRGALAWKVPSETRSPETGWCLTGAALGLDITLARLSLRRAVSETFPPPPAFGDRERDALAEAVVLTNPFDASEAEQRGLAAAVRAGQARLASVAGDPGRLAALAEEAGFDEWRANLWPWMAAHERERVAELVSLGELAAIGGADSCAPLTLAASGWSLRAELRGAPVAWASWTTLAGRKSVNLVQALVPDLAVGIAGALDRLAVPPALVRGVLTMATQDLLDSLRTNHDDDWMTLVGQAQRVAAGVVEDYVAGQTIWGALTPARGSTR